MKNFLPRTIFNEEHDMFRETCRSFVETEIRPNVDKWHEQGFCDRSMYQAAGELGLFGITSPEEFGGGGMPDYRFTAILSEELAEADCGSVIVSIQVINDLVIPYLERFATDEQKKKYLAPLCSGEKIGAIAMTEPGAGADLAGIRTTALKNDEGNFVLNGSKTFISNGVQADFTLGVAITDPSQGRAGVSILIVDAETEGFTRSVSRPRTPPSSTSRTPSSPPRTSSARRVPASVTCAPTWLRSASPSPSARSPPPAAPSIWSTSTRRTARPSATVSSTTRPIAGSWPRWPPRSSPPSPSSTPKSMPRTSTRPSYFSAKDW